MDEEQEVPSSKHVCKICDRRFSCGRALGGHMRIHGSQFNEDDGVRRRRVCAGESRNGLGLRVKQEQEQEQEQEASCGGDHPETKNNNPMYDLRRNRRRTWRYADLDYSFAAGNGELGGSKFSNFKNSQACGQCGEEFSCWNSVIRHMECHYDDNKVGREEEEEESEEEEEEVMGVYWDSGSDTEKVRERIKLTKGKRSNRTQRRPSPSSEVEFMANCLVMLASSGESWEPTIKPSSSLNRLDDECTTSGVRDLKRKKRPPGAAQDWRKVVPKKMKYQCKTCKKMFASFQALGGHRASHNKVKGCSAKQDDDLDDEIITSDEDLSKDLGKSSTTPALCDEEESIVLGSHDQKSPWLDLNLPAPDDEPKWLHPTQKQGLSSISTQ